MEKGGDTFKNTKEHILECCKISEKLNTAKILDGNIQYSDLFQKWHKETNSIIHPVPRLNGYKKALIKENKPEALEPCTSSNDCLCNRDAIFSPVFCMSIGK